MEPSTFSIDINRSRYQRMYLLILSLLSACTLYYLPLPLAIWLPVALGLVLLGVFHCWQWGRFRQDKALIKLQYHSQHWWLCVVDNSKQYPPRPFALTQATVWRWLIVMNFCCPDTGQNYHLTLWPDSANKAQLRHLRVVLRHQSVFGDIE